MNSPKKSLCQKSEFHPVSSKEEWGGNDLVPVMEKCWILNGSSDLEKANSKVFTSLELKSEKDIQEANL